MGVMRACVTSCGGRVQRVGYALSASSRGTGLPTNSVSGSPRAAPRPDRLRHPPLGRRPLRLLLLLLRQLFLLGQGPGRAPPRRARPRTRHLPCKPPSAPSSEAPWPWSSSSSRTPSAARPWRRACLRE
jgi:hypothetical protein